MTCMLSAHERITDSGIMDTENRFVITTVPEEWKNVSLLFYNLMNEDVSFQEFFSEAFNWFFYNILPLRSLPKERETCVGVSIINNPCVTMPVLEITLAAWK